MATHSSILAWEISWTEEPGGLQSIGLQRVRHDQGSKQSHFRQVSQPLSVFHYLHPLNREKIMSTLQVSSEFSNS